MLRRIAILLLSVAALSASGWMIASQFAESTEPLSSKVQQAMDEEAAKPRFSGQLGDFLVLLPLDGELPAEANIFGCPNGAGTQAVAPSASLRNEELWSGAFEDGGIGWSCPGQGVVLVNNEGGGRESGDGSGQARGYIRSVPVPVVRDAPRDRLELVTVEGHPGLLEHPIEGYPYGKANLVVIERYPDGDKPGIVVFVEMAPSAESAIRHAEEIMP